jgi:hypothetical protein
MQTVKSEGDDMSSVEQLFVMAMLTWTAAAQAMLWQLTRRTQPATAPPAVTVDRRRTSVHRSA